MKIRDLIPIIKDFTYIYGDIVDKSDMRYIAYGIEVVKSDSLIWSGYLYEEVPDNIADLEIKELCAYHERPYYLELDNCDVGIEIHT